MKWGNSNQFFGGRGAVPPAWRHRLEVDHTRLQSFCFDFDMEYEEQQQGAISSSRLCALLNSAAERGH